MSAGPKYLVFAAEGNAPDGDLAGEEVACRIWRPSLVRVRPPQYPPMFAAFWVMHYTGVFGCRDYCAVYMYKGGEFLHRLCVLPRYFRWPFMGRNDLQFSATWTDPAQRGQGYATLALRQAMHMLDCPGRKFWYVTRETNGASVAVCRKAGFSLVAEADRVPRFGIPLLGRLDLRERA